MSKFVESNGVWYHVDLPRRTVYFSRKPPEWMARDLALMYENVSVTACRDTQRHIRARYFEFVDSFAGGEQAVSNALHPDYEKLYEEDS